MRQILLCLSALCMIKSIQTLRAIAPQGWCGIKGCYLNGKGYDKNVKVQLGCFIFECIEMDDGYHWTYDGIDINCPTCSVSNDPHFHTFDSHNYDFHGLCNYSISQPIECCEVFPSYFPPYGIFSSFKMCSFGYASPSCLDLTTYKISDAISILIRHTYPVSLEINGDPLTVTSTPVSYYDCNSYTSSVMVWREGDCVYVVGNHYGIFACQHYMTIHTIPKHIYQIGGLCGYYSGTKDDEYRLRDCSEEIVGNEIIFGENWKTIDQNDTRCKKCYSKPDIKVVDCDVEKAESICVSKLEEVQKRCPSGYDEDLFSSVRGDCIEDCCSAGGIENCELWSSVAFDLLCSLNKFHTKKIESEGIKGK